MARHARALEPSTVDDKLSSAVAVLLRAFRYSEETSGERWEFAVEMQRFRDLGLDDNDLRWLVRKRFVEHAREVTPPGDDSRQFRSTGDLTFSKRTCFILTDAGVAFAQSMSDRCPVVCNEQAEIGSTYHHPVKQLPNWDAETRELTVRGRMVKRFKWQAVNQEIVLSTFQEDGWPAVIDDPLPPKLEQDSKRRLHDTIKALNRNQDRPILRFHGNGTGEGIRWELLDTDHS